MAATYKAWDEERARAEELQRLVHSLGRWQRREGQTYYFRDAVVLLRTSKRHSLRPGVINYWFGFQDRVFTHHPNARLVLVCEGRPSLVIPILELTRHRKVPSKTEDGVYRKMNILEEGGHLRLTAGGSHIPLDRFQGAYQLLSDSDERKGRIGLELPVEDSTAHPLEEPEDAIEQQEEEEERNHLSLERDLEEQLVRNLDQVEPELRLFDEDGKVGRQLRSDTGIIDVLAVAKTGDLVVIELKAGRAPDRALAQLLDYMEWVENRLASGREVRGILLAAQFDGRLERAARRVPSVRLLRYRIRFEIEPV